MMLLSQNNSKEKINFWVEKKSDIRKSCDDISLMAESMDCVISDCNS